MITRISLIRTLCLGAALLFTAGNSHADDGYLVFNTIAWHFDNSHERNDFTPGVGYEYSPSSAVGFHVGTLSDSFGYQAKYLGVNYATRRVFNNRLRLILGATIVNKQFKLANDGDDGVDTRVLPLPAIEFAFNKRAVLNISGSPEVDLGDQKNNAVMWFQLKVGLN